MITALAPLNRFFHRKPNPPTPTAVGAGSFSKRLCSFPSFAVRRPISCLSSHGGRSGKYAVLGAGFAGLSVAWHLLRQSPMELNVHIDMFDDAGIGGGASGVAGGLVHPYSPKVKLLWRGVEFWMEWLNLLNIAQEAAKSEATNDSDSCYTSIEKTHGFIIRRRIETIDKSAAQHLLPEVCAPLNVAFFMPEAMNINPQFYLEALFLACQNVVAGIEGKGLLLHKKNVASLSQLAGEYDAVIICLGAGVNMLPQLAGKLPLRTCRGIVAASTYLVLLPICYCELGAEYPAHSPVILSEAWLAVRPRSLDLGATWNWESRNPSQVVSPDP